MQGIQTGPEDRKPIRIEYQWKSVEISPGTAYVFPTKISKFMRNAYGRPAVYRWVVYSPKDEPQAIYFGEAESLVKRINQYLRPEESQQTNMRVHLNFHSYLENKCKVKLDVLDFHPFRLNSIVASASSLDEHYLRRMLEAFVIVDFVSSGGAINSSLMNLKMNPIARRVRRAIGIISETTAIDAPQGGPESCPPPSLLR